MLLYRLRALSLPLLVNDSLTCVCSLRHQREEQNTRRLQYNRKKHLLFSPHKTMINLFCYI